MSNQTWQVARAEAAAQRYRERLEKVSTALTDLAAQVLREGEPRDGDYLWAAQKVIHDVAWGVANLNLDILIASASDARETQREAIWETTSLSDET
jgi:hypothetical protein